MPVETDRLLIEPLSIEHADWLLGLLDPRVSEHFAPADRVQTPEQLRGQFREMVEAAGTAEAEERFLPFVVRERRSDTYIGRLEALVVGSRAEVAFVFVPGSWGRGFAGEATRALLGRLAAEYAVRDVWACVTKTNDASLRLCHRLGFVEAAPGTWPALATYDDGDVVLNRSLN
jgi:RimJ/RimL family protein N-acetyltransferase